MGGDISKFVAAQEREKTPAQEAQNELFREYQRESTVETMRAELQKWDSADGVILQMPLEEQAEYADYVTRKMCDPTGPYHHVWDEYVSETLAGLEGVAPHSLHQTTAIGNLALVIKSMPDGAEKEAAKQTLLTRLAK